MAHKCSRVLVVSEPMKLSGALRDVADEVVEWKELLTLPATRVGSRRDAHLKQQAASGTSSRAVSVPRSVANDLSRFLSSQSPRQHTRPESKTRSQRQKQPGQSKKRAKSERGYTRAGQSVVCRAARITMTQDLL